MFIKVIIECNVNTSKSSNIKLISLYTLDIFTSGDSILRVKPIIVARLGVKRSRINRRILIIIYFFFKIFFCSYQKIWYHEKYKEIKDIATLVMLTSILVENYITDANALSLDIRMFESVYFLSTYMGEWVHYVCK